MRPSAQDIRRLIEGKHDDSALDLAQVTKVDAMRVALGHTLAEYRAAHGGLTLALALAIAQAGETGEARARQAEKGVKAGEQYTYVRDLIYSALLVHAPEARPSAEELGRRRKLFDQLLSNNGSDLSRQSPKARVVILQTVLDALTAGPLRTTLGNAQSEQLRARLSTATEELATANADVEREVREDAVHFEALAQARTTFDHRQRVHLRQLETTLDEGNRLDEVGNYFLARDAAYRARRQAGAPIKAEPGVTDAATAVGATPDIIEEGPES